MTTDFNLTGSNQVQQLSHMLVQEGLVSAERMAVALYDKERTDLPLEEILILHGWVDSRSLDRALLRLCRQQLSIIMQAHT
jgi:hypothetical protein